MKEASEEYKDLTNDICVDISNKIVESKDQFDPMLYEVKEYKSHSGEILLRRVLDENKILLDPKSSNAKGFWTVTPERFFKEFCFLPNDRQRDFWKEYNQGSLTFIVKYSIKNICGNKETIMEEVLPKRL